MSDARWERIKELVPQALQLAPAQRSSFLDEACGADAVLRREIDSLLLAGAEMPGQFLQSRQRIGIETQALVSEGALREGELFAERYRVVHRLGEGGMGQVWLADQFEPVRRQVALKLIRAGMYDESVARRFHSECQSLAIMEHPAIAKVFDAGTTLQGQPYLVMEYVPGEPITAYCDRRKLPIRERLELFIQACEGVQHAHQKAIIHRDLKPANILVVEVDGKPVPRIIDFGLAKPARATVTNETLMTRLGNVMGTPGYMSPEQLDADAQEVDTRTDVYSLGVILYVLLTGLQPFETAGRQRLPFNEWLRQLREDEPPYPSRKLSADQQTSSGNALLRSTNPDHLVSVLRGDLDVITMKTLERERERRYGTPTELAADLRRYLNDEAVFARPASAIYQLRKFFRRHRVAAGFLTMVTALAFTASGAALIAIRQKHEAELQVALVRQAQARLLTQAAAQRLKDTDVAGAQSIILEVLTNVGFAKTPAPATINVFQEIRAADAQLAILSANGAMVQYANFSPDGRRIVTASNDKSARIWDARTAVQLAVLSGHEDQLISADYSPDGSRVVTASIDQTARIWDALSGKQLLVLAGHAGKLTSAAFSPDGTRVVTASADRTAIVWDARSGKQLAVLTGHGDYVINAAYSPDGTRVVTASNDRTARIWDARTGRQLAMISGSGKAFFSALYSRDGTRIVTASNDKTARVWDAHTGTLLAVLSGHSDYLNSAAFSPDGSRIVTASADKTARIWDASSGVQLAVLSGHGRLVASAFYSPDGSRIVTASIDGTARIWDAHTGGQVASLLGHNDQVTTAAYSPDGTRIVTASFDATARVWNANTGNPLGLLSGHGSFVYGAAYSRDGTRIVTALADRSARIFDAQSGSELSLLTGHGSEVFSAAFSPDGTRIVTASGDKSARVWDATSGASLAVLNGHVEPVHAAAYSPDGTRIVTGSDDKTVRVWDAQTRQQVMLLRGHTDRVLSTSYSPDGMRILSASVDGTARIWDAHTGTQLMLLDGNGVRIDFAAYSPDGTRVVTASHDGASRIWDSLTGVQLAVLLGHGDSVRAASYSPDGARIVTASQDRTARIWDAHIPATVTDQILWYAAAEADRLSAEDRAQFGLSPASGTKVRQQGGSACDRSAASDYDPERLGPGLPIELMTGDIAEAACAADLNDPQHPARSEYQMGRALVAKGDATGARRHFEAASARGYRVAKVDLADLLVQPSAAMLDPRRALLLYQQAWSDNLAIAAFNLGRLYEYGVKELSVWRSGCRSGRRHRVAVVPEGGRSRRTQCTGALCGARGGTCTIPVGCCDAQRTVAASLPVLRRSGRTRGPGRLAGRCLEALALPSRYACPPARKRGDDAGSRRCLRRHSE